MKAKIKADLQAAVRYVGQVELKLNQYEAGLSSITKAIDGKNSDLTAQYRKITEQGLDAKTAEIKAITSRYDIAANALSLTSGTNTSFVYYMFQSKKSYEKQSLTDVLMSRYKG